MGLFLLCAVKGAVPACSQSTQSARPPDNPPLAGVEQAKFYRLVKRFDFNERAVGNYEDTPMYWAQLEGPGLPTLYARGRLDDEVGRRAPPSFRLDIQTGNVGYECRHPDLAVIPGSDYLLTGYVRPDGLKFSHAFVAAYFIDRYAERIPGSERVSMLVAATGQPPEPWQRVEIALPGDFPTAHALRIQFWILQAYAWRQPDPDEVDPIHRRDVYATAWFDDFSIHRMPRLQLRFSEPGGLVLPDQRAAFIVEVSNASSEPVSAGLDITDGAGQLRHAQKLAVPARPSPVDPMPPSSPTTNARDTATLGLTPGRRGGATTVRVSVPELPPGFYRAQLRLHGDSEILLERSIRFAVLPALPGGGPPHPDIGVDLGCWQPGPIAGIRRLLTTLRCGAVKIGIPMVGDLSTQEKRSHFEQVSALLRDLGANRIDATGVMLSPSAGVDPNHGNSTRQFVSRGPNWRDRSSPILASYGALMSIWQLGAEEIELRDGGQWDPADIERVRSHLRGFVTIPRLAIPQPITAVTRYRDDVVTVWVPGVLPTRVLPNHLGFLLDGDASLYWLELGSRPHNTRDHRHRARDLARRLVLAKALNPARVFVPAPFELSRRGGHPAWQPTEDYLVLRTVFHCLSGKTAVAATRPAPDTLAVVFEGGDSSCMVIWSWRERPSPNPVELYLGPNPRAIDIWGQSVPLEITRGRTRLPVGPTPLIVEALHTPLALLQASYRVAPTQVQLHEPEPRPVLTFRNTYDAPLSGEVQFIPPGDWQIEPSARAFRLEPGETFTQPLAFTFPPRQIAQDYELGVRLVLHAPETAELRFGESLTVGLPEIGLETTAYWQGDDLVVEQSLRNNSDQPVSFAAFCEPPGRARVEGEFLDVMPGAFATQAYSFPKSRADLAGTILHVGIQEIDGPRALNQFAEVPP